jgi:hypothetical protein
MMLREIWSVVGQDFREGKIKGCVRFLELSLQINKGSNANIEWDEWVGDKVRTSS